jgi:uncharacterized protein with FMN-binding domain
MRTPKSIRIDRIWVVVAAITIVVAWLVGTTWVSRDVSASLAQVLPAASRFQRLSADTYAAYRAGSPEELIGYVAIAEANGFGGKIKVAVAVDVEGVVLNAAVVERRETPAWYDRIVRARFIERLWGKSYADPFRLGVDVDGVSGATYTARAIAEAVRDGSRTIASEQLNLPVPAKAAPEILFGVPEVVLIALFAVTHLAHWPKWKHRKRARWLTLLVGLAVLGFAYNVPLTVSLVSRFLLGSWPAWQTSLYWYLLAGGTLFFLVVYNRNPWCDWVCPFGAAQECLGAIGGAKARTPRRFRGLLTWLQRGLSWLAIGLALLFRNSGLSNYEVYGTLFTLQGSRAQFVLLGSVLAASLFIRRPWCRYLCPIPPVTGFLRIVRRWVTERWSKKAS